MEWLRGVLSLVLAVATASLDLPRGAAPQDISLYSQEHGVFFCRSDAAETEVPGANHQQALSMAVVNDDYCDCSEDGSDEPGTAACALGKFYCANVGSIPQSVPSALVGDGVCDCCDGSDEINASTEGELLCPDSCEAEADIIGKRLAKHLLAEREGERRSVELAAELPNHIADLNEEAGALEEKITPLMNNSKKIGEALGKVAKALKQEASGKRQAVPANITNGNGRVQASCFHLAPATSSVEGDGTSGPVADVVNEAFASKIEEAAEGGSAVANSSLPNRTIFAVNASCIAAKACGAICSMLCQDSRKHNGTCTIEDPQGGRDHVFLFDQDALAREAFYAKMREKQGQKQSGPQSETEETAIEHMVVQEGESELDAKWLALRQQLQKQQVKAQPFIEQHSKVKGSVRLIEGLHAANGLGPGGVYHSLAGTCLNATQEQFVGTTAVREQWHTFHYDICFFDYVTQHEVKFVDEAAACDESGVCTSAPSEDSEPEKQFLGQAIGFLPPDANIPIARFGIEEPRFFDFSEHTLLFAKGGPCPGGVHRALAANFACGLETKVEQISEVRMCAYVAEVSHPAPCNLSVWPASLSELAYVAEDAEHLSASISSSWLSEHSDALHVIDGPLDWGSALATARAAREFLSSIFPPQVKSTPEIGSDKVDPECSTAAGAEGECAANLKQRGVAAAPEDSSHDLS